MNAIKTLDIALFEDYRRLEMKFAHNAFKSLEQIRNSELSGDTFVQEIQNGEINPQLLSKLYNIEKYIYLRSN